MSKYADIALPVAVEKTFTYLVPPELQQSATVGVRAIVPFGRKFATGLIVGLPATSTIAGLRPIKDIIDPSPLVSDELLHLCNWISDYYFAPLGEVLKAAIPHGFSSGSRKVVQTSFSATDEAIEILTKRTPKRAKLLTLLRKQGPMLSTELQKKVGLKNINVVVNEMVKAGYLESEEMIMRPKQTAREKEYVLLDKADDKRLDVELRSISPRKKNARQLLTSIQSYKEQGIREIALTDLLKNSRVSSKSLAHFRTSGLLTVVRREVSRHQEYGTEQQTLNIVLNAIQQQVLRKLNEATDSGVHKTFLLHGVTGSGKTQVYIEAIRYCLERGKSAIVLVPEISLTPQIVRRFKSHFGNLVGVVHSRISAGERYDVWRLARRGDYRIIIGPRSAIFAPLSNIGLIVVDEEHEASYKQFDSTPRYNARDAAIVRGKHINAVVVLGSATPSAESYFNATTGNYVLLEMPGRIDEVRMPEVAIVDMTAERKREYNALKESLPETRREKLREYQQSSISSCLRTKIEERLNRKEGIILLQNRRGFAPFIECVDCGYTETCTNCNVTLTYHLAKKHLRCHYCGLVRAPHAQCPECFGPNIQLRGIGTQRVETELATLLPQARVLRMDLDTTSRKGAHDRLLRKFGDGDADILLGTQMVGKGLDFPRVTLVGVVSADTQMLLPDFRATERTFQLLTQVAGRSGRSALQGEVIIQTHQPQHYALQHVVDHDFSTFIAQELQARRELDYPPFSRLVLIEAKGKKEEQVRQEAERFTKLLKGTNGAFTVLGPSPAVIGKIKNQYRWHIIVKNKKASDPSGSHLRRALRTALTSFQHKAQRTVRLIIDVDPVGLL